MRECLILAVLSGALLWAPLQAAELQSGPMLGHVDVVEATIWVQTTEPAKVSVRYWQEGGEPVTSKTVQTTASSYLVAKVLLTNLKENTAYEYRVLINGQDIERPYPTRFKTQMHWWWRTDPPTIKFAIGSCFYVNDPPYDRPGNPYGGDYEILDAIAKSGADFMVWAGDNTYFRESDFYSPTRLNYRWKHTRSLPELQPLLAAMAHYGTWDDHDFGPNDSDRSYGLKHVALDLFKAYWDNPQFGMPDTPGVFGVLNWGDIDIFFLDDRYHRAPNRLRDPDADYLGAKQLQWLKDALAFSRASFKIVVNGNQFTNEQGQSREGFHLYRREFDSFFGWLRQSRIQGVIFMSGDIHRTELIKTPRPRLYPLYEFTCSPLTSGAGNRFSDNPFVVEGTRVGNKRNFGLVTITGPRQQREMTIEVFDKAGDKLWGHSIKRAELSLNN